MDLVCKANQQVWVLKYLSDKDSWSTNQLVLDKLSQKAREILLDRVLLLATKMMLDCRSYSLVYTIATVLFSLPFSSTSSKLQVVQVCER